MSLTPNFTFGFWGAGRMTSAMVVGLLSSGRVRRHQLACIDGGGGSADRLAAASGIETLGADGRALATRSAALVIACKPAQAAGLKHSPVIEARGIPVFSVVAGLPLETLTGAFPHASNVIRLMPNTPGRVGAGITAWCPARPLKPEEADLRDTLLNPLGSLLHLEEALFEPFTAICGSGPAYFFEFTRQLEEAALALGVPAHLAPRLARETFLGAAQLASRDGRSLAALRDEVTSPGGTTEAALKVMAREGLGQIITDAARMAAKRCSELRIG